MNKLVKNIISFSLRNRMFIIFCSLILAGFGIYCTLTMPIDAYPNVTPTIEQVMIQWPGASAEDMEKLVTIPTEVQLSQCEKKVSIRSITMFGLTQILIGFDDGIEDWFARDQVVNNLRNVTLPAGAASNVSLNPNDDPTCEVYRYTLEGGGKTVMELKTIQDWIVDHQFRMVKDVADVNTYGGPSKIYEVQVNADLLRKYHITAQDAFNAISNSNINSGGDVIEQGDQSYVVKGVGLLKNLHDIENIIIQNNNGVPLLLKNVGTVKVDMMPRLGQVGRDSNPDAVLGVVLMRRHSNPEDVLAGIHKKVEELNSRILPTGVKIVPFYDRTTLINYCTTTVWRNVSIGILLVIGFVFLFLMDWRCTVIVSVIIPLSLLFANMMMDMLGMSINLLSLGAVDYGIIIDGTIVLVEGAFALYGHYYLELGQDKFNKRLKMGWIKKAGLERAKAITFANFIIIVALIPIFSFQKVEAKLFHPLAYTIGFHLLGSLIFTLTLIPVMISLMLNKNTYERKNPIVHTFINLNFKFFHWGFNHKKLSLTIACAILAGALYCVQFMGSEFLPHLDEGGMWVKALLPLGISMPRGHSIADSMRADFAKYQEVIGTTTQTGRPDDGTDPEAFSDIQMHVQLRPRDQWQHHIGKDSLIAIMNEGLYRKYPGIVFNFSQPIRDNVEQAVSGMNASLACKLTGEDLNVLTDLAKQVEAILKTVPGVYDLGILKCLGQPELAINLNWDKMALYGVNTQQATSIVGMSIGGVAATTVYEGEKQFDLRVRYQPQDVKTAEQIGDMMIPTINGGQIRLREIADITKQTGVSFIFRDDNSRMLGVKFSNRERDLGSTIAEAKEKLKAVHLPRGYQMSWLGEYEDEVRAMNRLAVIVPICLLLIFLILFATFGNMKDPTIIMMTIPFALIGCVYGLLITHIHFSISAGIGFVTMLGVCTQNGVMLIVEFNKNRRERGLSVSESILEGVMARRRPVLMTAIIDIVGLLPAAMSTDIGSEAQRPLATAMISGFVSSELLVILVLPILYYYFYSRKGDTVRAEIDHELPFSGDHVNFHPPKGR
jgi:heavy metal efflux system protein